MGSQPNLSGLKQSWLLDFSDNNCYFHLVASFIVIVICVLFIVYQNHWIISVKINPEKAEFKHGFHFAYEDIHHSSILVFIFKDKFL